MKRLQTGENNLRPILTTILTIFSIGA